jgi:2-methylcitrate synthase/citrate synthase II
MRANKGLAGLIAGDTAISKVDVSTNSLWYRGYDINELCEKTSFLEVAYLLLNKDLPSASELKIFEEFERENRDIPDSLYELFKKMPKYGHPMDLLNQSVSILGSFDKENVLGTNSQEENLRKSMLLFAKMPTVVANSYRLSQGLEAVKPNKNLSYSENFLSMILGKEVKDSLSVKTFDKSMILYAEHGYNASTFSARVTAATLSDLYSAVSTAIGTLKGPLHGGANEQVMYMLKEIKSVDRAKKYTLEKINKKEKIMGFGHRLYRTGDSRTAVIKKLGKELATKLNKHIWHDISDIMEKTMIEEKGIYPNLDFPAASAYYLLCIPIELYTPIFAASRITGWAAHIIEQHNDNRLIRPGCDYIGPDSRTVKPISKRGNQ